jgi:tetratricopeptide (TPR) repeat protein
MNGAELIDACQDALTMARRIGEQDVEADLLAEFAELLAAAPDRRWEEAVAAAQQALALAQQLQQPWLQASTLNILGLAHLDQRRYDEAVGCLQRALPLSVGSQRGRMEGVIEGNLSKAHTALGNYEHAIQHARREYVLRQQAGERTPDGIVSLHMALARQGQGAHQEVIRICGPAIDLLESQQIDPAIAAELLDAMAVSLNVVGERADALDCWRRAVATFDMYDYPRAAGIRDRIRDLDQPVHREKQSDG